MTLPLLWLAGRLAGSVWASLLQKRLLSAGIGTGRLWLLTYGLLIPPALVLLLVAGGPVHPGFWKAALLAALLDVAGNIAMAAALRDTDLSVYGPLNAFRPALAWLGGWLFLGEHPTIGGLAGVVVLMLGAFWLLAPSRGTVRGSGDRRFQAALWRLFGLSLSTAGAVCLKQATLAGSAEQTLGVWVLGGWAIAVLAPPLTQRLRTQLWTREDADARPQLFLHAAVFFAMQWLTLKVFRHTLLAYSFAFFQLGMVVQVLLGRWLLGEPEFRRRLLACGVMSAGALLVLVAG